MAYYLLLNLNDQFRYPLAAWDPGIAALYLDRGYVRVSRIEYEEAVAANRRNGIDRLDKKTLDRLIFDAQARAAAKKQALARRRAA